MTPLLVILALDACALADHACRARDYEARAQEAGISHDLKVQRLYLAHREHLFDFDETGRAQALCDARRALAVVRAATPTPAAMLPRFEKTEGETAERERRTGISCSSSGSAGTTAPRKLAARPPAPRRRAPSPEPMPVAPPPRPLESASSPVPLDSEGLLAVPTGGARVLARALAPESPAPAAGPEKPPSPATSPGPRPASRAPRVRDGGGLLVAGGVLLTTAAGLGGGSLYAYLVREDLIRREHALAAHASELGFTDSATLAARADFVEHTRLAHRWMVGAGVASGLSAGAALVALAVGGHRRALHRRRLDVLPTLGGLLLRGRF